MLDGAKKNIEERESQREWRRWRVLISNATFSISNIYSVGLSLCLLCYVPPRQDNGRLHGECGSGGRQGGG